ncbi:hypothetical protein AMTRI_Chr04g186730 [Amborella trichopoda]
MGKFLLGVIISSSKLFFYADPQHRFNARESDWGFTSFMPRSALNDLNKGYLVNDTIVVEAEVVVLGFVRNYNRSCPLYRCQLRDSSNAIAGYKRVEISPYFVFFHEKASKLFFYADTQHQFNAREGDWGFTSFMPRSAHYGPNNGYLVNHTIVVEAEDAVCRVVDYCTFVMPTLIANFTLPSSR